MPLVSHPALSCRIHDSSPSSESHAALSPVAPVFREFSIQKELSVPTDVRYNRHLLGIHRNIVFPPTIDNFLPFSLLLLLTDNNF